MANYLTLQISAFAAFTSTTFKVTILDDKRVEIMIELSAGTH